MDVKVPTEARTGRLRARDGEAPTGAPTQVPAGAPTQVPAGAPTQVPAENAPRPGALTQVPAGAPTQVPAENAPRPGAPAEEPRRPRTKAAQREATVGALITAARELFAERGYAGVGTEEIVQRAGVTRGALYHHFRAGKEELFRAVLVQVSAEIVQRVAAAAAATDDPWEELVLGSEAFLDACATPEVQRIVLLDAPAVLEWDVRRAIDADYGLRLLEGAVRNAIDAGRMMPASPAAVAQVLAGALDEAAMVVARAEDPVAAREEMSLTVRRLLEGLRAPTP
jgi:AcrR family transcriptional regulator